MRTVYHILVYLVLIFLNSCFPQNDKQSRVKTIDFPDLNPTETESITPHVCLAVVAKDSLRFTLSKTKTEDEKVLNLSAKTVFCAKGTYASDPYHLHALVGEKSGTVDISKVKCDDGKLKLSNEKTCKLAFEGVEKLESEAAKSTASGEKNTQGSSDENTKSEEGSVAIAAPKSASTSDSNTITCKLKCGFNPFCGFINCSLDKVTIAKFSKSSTQSFDYDSSIKNEWTLAESPFCSISRGLIDEKSCNKTPKTK